MTTLTTQRIGSRAAGAMLGAAMVFALMLMTARQAGAQEREPDGDFTACTDDAWAEYNGCLVTSNCWMERIQCDWSFEIQMIGCAIEEVGAIRGATRV